MLGLLDRAWRLLPGASPEARLQRARALAGGGQFAEAAAIWQDLADIRIARAQTNLGACFANGDGVPRCLITARHWLQHGAEAGDPVGQRNLATLLLDDDKPAAAEWYREAAEQGDAVSQDQLSRMLAEGDGVPQDWPVARFWATSAAKQGVAPAAYRLAMLCHEAKGGPRDPAAAAHWWREAARAGHADAAAMLGGALHMGQGVGADQVAAMAWLLVGSARHSTLVRPFFAKVEALLSPDELAEARARADRGGE